MTERPPGLVLLLGLLSFGIYLIVWMVKSKEEMANLGADVPTCWLMLIPLVNIFWVWKFYGGVRYVTGGKTRHALLFVIAVIPVVGLFAPSIVQHTYNEVGRPAAA